jgi:hypothetical protein
METSALIVQSMQGAIKKDKVDLKSCGRWTRSPVAFFGIEIDYASNYGYSKFN